MEKSEQGRRASDYGWIALVLAGVFTIGFVIPNLGQTGLQERGLWRLWLGFSPILVGSTSFRMGDRWSWFLMLSLVTWLWSYVVNTQSEVLTPIFSSLALIVGFRKFFPLQGRDMTRCETPSIVG